MKKHLSVILALILALATVLPTASCGLIQTAKAERGTKTDNTYVNESMNLCFTLPAGWVFYTDEQMMDLMNATAEQLNDPDLLDKIDGGSIFEFMAINSATGANISMLMEKLAVTVTMDSYIKSFRKQFIEDGSQAGFTDQVIADETGTAKLGGCTFTTLHTSAVVNGKALTQEYYLCKKGTTLVCIIFTDVNNTGTDWFEGLFTEAPAADSATVAE